MLLLFDVLLQRQADMLRKSQFRVVAFRAILIAVFFCEDAASELPNWLALKGYIDYSQQILVSPQNWTAGSILQNRLEGTLYPADVVTVAAALRTRMLYGGLYAQLFPLGYKKTIDNDPGWADLSVNMWDNRSAVFTSMFDRLYVDYSKNDWQIRLGRHRINWGKDLIWNPNDIFNAQSFLDVSYREGPGTDGLLVRRYLGPVAQVEAAVAGARDADSITAAACGQINVKGFDIQLLGGWMRHDIVIGTGFSGQIADVALRGEGTLFCPDSMNNSAQFVGCLSVEYLLPREVRLLLSTLYNSKGKKSPADGFSSLFNERITAKTLSPAMFQLMAQVSWQATPLFSIECTSLINPADWSALLMPRATYSLNDNLEMSLQAQIQAGGKDDQFGGKEHVVFWGVQWCF